MKEQLKTEKAKKEAVRQLFENMSQFWASDIEDTEKALKKEDINGALKILGSLKKSLLNLKQGLAKKAENLSEKYLKCTNTAKKVVNEFSGEHKFGHEHIENLAKSIFELMKNGCLNENLEDEHNLIEEVYGNSELSF